MKNLSDVLNEVMTDIFTEDDGYINKVVDDGVMGKIARAVTPDFLERKIAANHAAPLNAAAAHAGEVKQAFLDNQKREAFNAAMAGADEKKLRFLDDQLHKSQENQPGFGGAQENPAPLDDPSYLEQLKQGASNLGSTIAQGATDAGNYLAQKGQEAAAAYQSMHPALQYGIPAAALAAGAGALYLRKKQKAANKAAGIR